MELVFRDDAYARACDAVVTAATPAGVALDRTVFYPDRRRPARRYRPPGGRRTAPSIAVLHGT